MDIRVKYLAGKDTLGINVVFMHTLYIRNRKLFILYIKIKVKGGRKMTHPHWRHANDNFHSQSLFNSIVSHIRFPMLLTRPRILWNRAIWLRTHRRSHLGLRRRHSPSRCRWFRAEALRLAVSWIAVLWLPSREAFSTDAGVTERRWWRAR